MDFLWKLDSSHSMKLLNSHKLVLLLSALMMPLLFAEEKQEHPLQGGWTGHKIVEGGRDMPDGDAKAGKMFFDKGALKVVLAKGELKGTYTVDDSKTPKWLDLKVEAGGEVMTVLAVYDIKDGLLRMCHFNRNNGEKRPRAIKDTEDFVLATFKKIIVEEKAAKDPEVSVEKK